MIARTFEPGVVCCWRPTCAMSPSVEESCASRSGDRCIHGRIGRSDLRGGELDRVVQNLRVGNGIVERI